MCLVTDEQVWARVLILRWVQGLLAVVWVLASSRNSGSPTSCPSLRRLKHHACIRSGGKRRAVRL